MDDEARKLADQIIESWANEKGADPLELIEMAYNLTDVADDVLEQHVKAAREAGHTWQAIGLAAGVSKSRAIHRWGPGSAAEREADRRRKTQSRPNPDGQPERTISVAEAAEREGVTEATIRRRIKLGQVESVRVGHRVWVRP